MAWTANCSRSGKWWNRRAFHRTALPGLSGNGVDCVDPTSRIIRANGDKAFFGWPNNPQIEAEVAAWYEAKTLDEERAIARRLNKAAFEHAIYAPLGLYLQQQAWRTNVAGVAQGPLPFFWGVSKTA